MIILPQSAVKADQLKAYLEGIKAKLMATAPKELIRDLLPLTDLGYTTEEWDNEQTLSANAWTMDISHALDEDEEIVIIGVFNLTDDPQVLGVKFKIGSTGATTLAIYNIQKLYTEESVIGYFDEPVRYKKKDHVYIEYYAKSSVSGGNEKIGLIGYMRKPYGEEISKAISF